MGDSVVINCVLDMTGGKCDAHGLSEEADGHGDTGLKARHARRRNLGRHIVASDNMKLPIDA